MSRKYVSVVNEKYAFSHGCMVVISFLFLLQSSEFYWPFGLFFDSGNSIVFRGNIWCPCTCTCICTCDRNYTFANCTCVVVTSLAAPWWRNFIRTNTDTSSDTVTWPHWLLGSNIFQDCFGVRKILNLGVFDTLSDSIQFFNFAKKRIHSIFYSILPYSTFNSKYYSIQRKFCWINSKDDSIQ